MKKRLIWLFIYGFVALIALLFCFFALITALYPVKYRDEIEKSALRHSVEPHLVMAVINTESSFKPLSVSSAGAVGLMQIMPKTAEWFAPLAGEQYSKEKLKEPKFNINLGTAYLAYLFERFDKNTLAALAAYNAGEGVVAKWIEEQGGELITIPYKETRNYCRRVLKAYKIYLTNYASLFNNYLK